MSAGQLEIRITTARSGLAEAILEAHGALAISVFDAGTEPIVAAHPHAQPAFDSARVAGLFAADTDSRAVVAGLREALGHDATIDVATVAERDWRDAWRAHHPPRCFAGRLWVAPSTAELAPGDAAVVRLDPGLAFGTGAHETTALCLDWLASAEIAGRRVLDYGCGSGILAIAAAKLGAAAVVAVDTDAQALAATRANAAANAVADRVATPTTAAVPAPAFDVLLANVFARPLIALAPRLIGHLAPGGWLVLSGLLTRHVDDLRAAYGHAVDFDAPRVENDWVCLAGRCRA